MLHPHVIAPIFTSLSARLESLPCNQFRLYVCLVFIINRIGLRMDGWFEGANSSIRNGKT
jgi:hypothetical protein